MDRLDGKVAIVTGAARGQGAATARLFVSEGAKVVLTDLLEQEGEAVAAELGDEVVVQPRCEARRGADGRRRSRDLERGRRRRQHRRRAAVQAAECVGEVGRVALRRVPRRRRRADAQRHVA